MANRFNIFFAFLMVLGAIPTIAGSVTQELVRSSTDQSMADSITVAGRFRNIAENMPRIATIIECDISNKSVREICELDSNSSFCRKIPLSYPHTFTVNYNQSNFINVFAAPGDSIYMDIDASTTPLSVSFSGDHEDINRQYNRAFQHMQSYYWSVNLPSDTVAFDEYMPIFKEYIRQGRDSIACYARVHNLSDEVTSMLHIDNIYSLANMANGYQGRNMEEKRAFFLDPIFDLFNEENTKLMIFPYHISAIMNYFPDVRDSAPKGTVRDIMYVCDEEAPTPDRSVFFNQNYYNRLYTQNNPVNIISLDGIRPGDFYVYINREIKEISDVNPITWLINENNRHPIYLDVSATWCGPCRAAIKGSEYIREHYKDSDMKFAIIWLNSSKEAWLKVAPTISNSIQIFIDNVEMEDRIKGHLRINGYPTCLMIDKDGNITKEGVPHYLSPELPSFLNSHL